MFDRPTFVFNVSEFDGRSLEEVLARFEAGPVPQVGAALVDASYAAQKPHLLARLSDLSIGVGIDPQSLRFGSPSFTAIPSLARLPYAPTAPLTAASGAGEIQRFVTRAMRFQEAAGAAFYVVPALPFLTPLGPSASVYRRIHELACRVVGDEVRTRPILAYAPPSTSVLRSPFALLSQLTGLPLAGIYFQPLSIHPKQDSVERLVAYGTFIRLAASYGLPVVAGRTGAFGLVLAAIGAVGFDSGLNQRESFDLAGLVKPRKKRPDGRSQGGRSRRIYLASVLTTLQEKQARPLLTDRTLRAQLACHLGTCRFSFENTFSASSHHYLHSRQLEVAGLTALPTVEMRIDYVDKLLARAHERAVLIDRVLDSKGATLIDFGHINRWQAALARLTGRRTWRRAS